jgi:hypothetical protein
MASGHAKRTTRKPARTTAADTSKKRSKIKLAANIAVVGVGLAAVGLLAVMGADTNNTRRPSSIGGPSTFASSLTPVSKTEPVDVDTTKPTGFAELWDMPADDRAGVDIARMNLIVAKGVPDARGLDIEANLARLDEWARLVAAETDRYMHMFQRDPSQYHNSEAYFRILTMITVLQQDLGVRYNPERAATPDFTQSQDLFVHGMIPSPTSEAEGGTCVSMPVLYTAVARRLGYPVSLVTTKAHVFCRWEDDTERFNIEASGTGLNVFEDDHYKSWPFELTDAEVERFGYLESLDADESLAVFIASAGHMMTDMGNPEEAGKIYNLARILDPDNPLYSMFMRGTADQLAGQPADQDAWASRLGATDRDKQRARRTESTEDMIARINEMNRRNRARLGNPDPFAPPGVTGSPVLGVPSQPQPFNPVQPSQLPIPGG